VVVITVALGAGSGFFLSLNQQKLFRASADVFLNTQNLAVALSNVQLPWVDPVREVETQADLARTPDVAGRALRRAGLTGRTPDDLLGSSSVSTATNADLLTFSVTDPDPAVATRLATAYAQAYTDYRRSLDTTALIRARTEVEQRIQQLKAAGQEGSALYATLVEKDQQLRTMEVLQGSNALLVRSAGQAGQIQPQPKRNGILGGVLGLVVGIGLAFLFDALNTRVRTSLEVEEQLEMPLLGRIPEPPRRLRANHELLMLAEPHAPESEAFHIVATNLDFVNIDRGARSILITSARNQEGKSTTAANLAVALARAGRRVALVDLDLRRPSLQHFFDPSGQPGLTQVLLGHAELEQALLRVHVADDDSGGTHNGSVDGLLEVLTVGPIPPNPAELARSHGLTEVLAQLEARADVLLIDAPPLLGLSDAVTLSAKVDALIVVVHLSTLRRPVLDELRRVLDAAPIVKLGFVVTGAVSEPAYGYGYGYKYGYGGRKSDRKERERVR